MSKAAAARWWHRDEVDIQSNRWWNQTQARHPKHSLSPVTPATTILFGEFLISYFSLIVNCWIMGFALLLCLIIGYLDCYIDYLIDELWICVIVIYWLLDCDIDCLIATVLAMKLLLFLDWLVCWIANLWSCCICLSARNWQIVIVCRITLL